MRLSLSALLPLFCATASCFGGPTSDWPGKNHDDTPPSTPPEPGVSDSAGHGETPPPAVLGGLDAGSSVPIAIGEDDGEDDGGARDRAVDGGVAHQIDGGNSHGGVAHQSDAGDSDAGLLDGGPPACSVYSAARTVGSCYGVYCRTTPEQLQHDLSVVGQCRDVADLTLSCNGELTRVVSACAQEDVLTLGLGSTVVECARAEPSLQNASDGCIDCYVSELLCAVRSCLTACLADLSPSCTECRSAHCGKAFHTCTGLPAP